MYSQSGNYSTSEASLLPMSKRNAEQIYDVAIIGLGPAGTTLANLLGGYGLRVAAIEQDRNVYPFPRAVHADDETLRILQATGLMEQLQPALGDYDRREYINAKGEIFFKTKLPSAKPLGYRTDAYFHQPTMDSILRDGLNRFDSVDLWLGYELTNVSSLPDYEQLRLSNVDSDEQQSIKAHFIVGCDGSRSFIRKHNQFQFHDLGFEQPWLVVDLYLNEGETRESADVPLIHRQYCDPAQPISYIPVGVQGHFRWEFMITDPATIPTITDPENVRRLLSLVIDPDKFSLARAAVYTFHSLVAEKWQTERHFIAGDAAHQMPPFAGQGMCCGLRDVHNLAWKLALVTSGHADRSLLNSYQQERQAHVTRMTRGAMFLGGLVQTRNPTRAWLRDILFHTLFRIPRLYRQLANFALRPPNLISGLMAGTVTNVAGMRFPQPPIITAKDEVLLLDDLMGNGFVVLGADRDPAMLAGIADLALGPVGIATGIIEVPNRPLHPPDSSQTALIIDPAGSLADWLEAHDCHYVVIRPDKYIYGGYRDHTAHLIASDLRRDLALLQANRKESL